jgi:hypothetical protein
MKSFANAAVFGLVPIPPIPDALALDDDVDRHIDRRLSQRRGAVAQGARAQGCALGLHEQDPECVTRPLAASARR